jgi:hypothetical protein
MLRSSGFFDYLLSDSDFIKVSHTWRRINVKLGGINVITDPTQVTLLSDPHNPTVVMGADVMHPGYGAFLNPLSIFSASHALLVM